jgi:LasA protease
MRLLIAIAAFILVAPLAPAALAPAALAPAAPALAGPVPAAGLPTGGLVAAPRDDLVRVVRQLALTRSRAMTSGTAQVGLDPRSNSRWGFGTVALPAPRVSNAYPQGWLFLARRDNGRWTVGFEGDAVFADLGGDAAILTADEKRTFGTSVRAEAVSPADKRTGMRLPYALNQSWRLTGGPHPMNGGVRSSIDLAGGDGRVLAARGGLAYTMCGSGKGWIRVVHDRGFATDYYHLAGNIRANGLRVKAGDFLGNIGNDVSCGGSTTGAHVHFSLRRENQYVPIDRYVFGKWVITAGVTEYDGWAYHGSKRVAVGGRLENLGALNFNQGIIDTDGGTFLNKRSGPGTNYPVVSRVADGVTVTVACSKLGGYATGRNNYRTNLWNRMLDGTWISDAYLWTGTGDPVSGMCP